MHEIFISYRRDDSQDAVGRIHDWLDDYFSPEATFRDIDGIETGDEFPARLDEALDKCKVVLVVIGTRWLERQSESAESRLFDDGDFVRREVAQALRSRVRVIPVLVSGATMPHAHELPEDIRGLCMLQAQVIESTRNFRRDLEGLVGRLGTAAGLPIHDYPTAVKHCRQIELISTWFGLMSTSQDVIQQIENAKSLLIVMNDGRGFLDAMRERIRDRDLDLDKTTRIAVLHPRSEFLTYLIAKNGKDMAEQMGNARRGFEALCHRDDDQPHCRIEYRGSHGYFPSSYLITEDCAFVSPYFCAEVGALPVFKFVHAAGSRHSLYPKLLKDAESVMRAAELLTERDFLPAKA